jgi:hypothetical protein
MPIHDWTRVRANRFHDFHQGWTVAICNALNGSLIPPGYFALVEQKTGVSTPEVIALELAPPKASGTSSGLSAQAVPPQARFVARTEGAGYARMANRIAVHHPDGDVVAVIEVVSPGNKSSRHAVATFARKAVALLDAGIHLLIVDLFPPNRRNPQGIHKVIWERLDDEPFALPPDRPLTLAAYVSGTEIVAYVEPVAVGAVLLDMPIFLTPDHYVLCPLEATYAATWQVFPAPLKGPLEASLPPTE